MVTDISKGRLFSVPMFRGLSTDDKPMDVPNGAEFYEMDTGINNYYDESTNEWLKVGKEEEGGGGGDVASNEIIKLVTVRVPQEGGSTTEQGLATEDNPDVPLTYSDLETLGIKTKPCWLRFSNTNSIAILTLWMDYDPGENNEGLRFLSGSYGSKPMVTIYRFGPNSHGEILRYNSTRDQGTISQS